MCETLTILGTLICAIALRLCRMSLLRKMGAALLLMATFLVGYFVSGFVCIGFALAGLWFLLPWMDLLGRVRHLKMSLENGFCPHVTPRDTLFPNAAEAVQEMQEAGFEHVTDSGWDWEGMRQYCRIFWNPEEYAIGTVCLCEKDNAAFAFISLTSKGLDGGVWRTTNFPFSPSLRCAHGVAWNHVPCVEKSFHEILRQHHAFLKRRGKTLQDMRMPDPEFIVAEMQEEMRQKLDYNHKLGLLEKVDSHTFLYSTKGLFFLWWQQVKDMVRLC